MRDRPGAAPDEIVYDRKTHREEHRRRRALSIGRRSAGRFGDDDRTNECGGREDRRRQYGRELITRNYWWSAMLISRKPAARSCWLSRGATLVLNADHSDARAFRAAALSW